MASVHIRIFSLTLLVLVLAKASGQQAGEGACMSVMRQLVASGAVASVPSEGITAIHQARPGERGPVGPSGARGLKGNKGEPGVCDCVPDEVATLREELDLVKTRLKRMKELCYIGISTGVIPTADITASSTHAHCPISQIPLHSQISWCAGTLRAGEYVQVDLKTPRKITGILTQGRRSTANQWVTSFTISYGTSTASLASIKEGRVDKVFTGNSDMDSVVKNLFPEPVVARYIRIYPVGYNSYKSMRIELLDC